MRMFARRELIQAAFTAIPVGLAGCVSDSDSGGDGSPRSPAQVTTSSAAGIEILVAQIAIASDAAGPDAYYRLTNTAETDAVIRLETRLSIEGGGTYSAFALVTVPAGDDVTVRYRIVAFEALSEAERRQVRNGEGVSFEVYVNGQRYEDV